MKKIILTIVCCVTSLITYAQCPPYKALSTFNKDTTAYIKYNFRDRADCYKGKTISFMLSNLECPVKEDIYTVDGKFPSEVDGLMLCIYDKYRMFDLEEKGLPSSTIWVEFTTPLSLTEVAGFYRQHGDIWTPQHLAFYGNQIIKSMGVVMDGNRDDFSTFNLKTPSGTINAVGEEYVNSMMKIWNIDTGVNQPVVIECNIETEPNQDVLQIYGIDSNDKEHLIATRSGVVKGEKISTVYPTGKAKVIFITNNQFCGYPGPNNDDEHYRGVECSYSCSPYYIADNEKIRIGVYPTGKAKFVFRTNGTVCGNRAEAVHYWGVESYVE